MSATRSPTAADSPNAYFLDDSRWWDSPVLSPSNSDQGNDANEASESLKKRRRICSDAQNPHHELDASNAVRNEDVSEAGHGPSGLADSLTR